MNITQMEYLAEIVQSDFNITAAAEKLYVSQSAISQFIKTFEKQNEVELFIRKNGRIIKLTQAGKRIYESSLEVLEQYYQLENTLKNESLQQKGTIKIGIHPTVLRLFFTKFIPRFMSENPEAYIHIVENGTVRLREMLIDHSIQAAILVHPTELNPDEYEEHQLMRTEVAAFMRPGHPLAKKRILTWEDLNDYHFVTYSEKDKVYHLIKEKLDETGGMSNLLFTSDSWDYMIESVMDNDHIAVLPTIYFDRFVNRVKHIGVVEKRFKDPVSYIPVLARPVKKIYPTVESFVFDSILENFYSDDMTLKYDI